MKKTLGPRGEEEGSEGLACKVANSGDHGLGSRAIVRWGLFKREKYGKVFEGTRESLEGLYMDLWRWGGNGILATWERDAKEIL